MKIGLVGLGRMGGNIARRLMQAGHQVVAWDRSDEAVQTLAKDGAEAATGLSDMATKLADKAIWWVMLPAGGPTEDTIAEIAKLAKDGDVIIDGGNSFARSKANPT